MPRGDGSGPSGMGPMTGRGAGYCAGFATPGFANSLGGRGRGAGFGAGRGLGWGRGRGWGLRATGPGAGYFPPPAYPVYPMETGYGLQPQDNEAQLRFLKSQAEMLSESLANITKQIEGFEEQDQA